MHRMTTPPGKPNNFLAALSEAAFMTGLERNADVVRLATYAPLFAHVDAWQWNPDLIWFDNLRMMRTPNYYVQQMYGMNAGTDVLNLQMDGKPRDGAGQPLCIGSAGCSYGRSNSEACQCGQQIGEGTDRVQRIEEAAACLGFLHLFAK